MSLITDNNILKDVCNKLSKSSFIAIDTEFMRENTYWPKLCLIQLATPTYNAIIDPLASGIDLKPLDDIMENKEIIKVFHACRQDLEIFYNRNKKLPKPIADTQILGMVCGFGDSVSYEILSKELINKKVDKFSRFTDWTRRPLTQRQINYALEDVIYLTEIYQKLLKKVSENNREEWINEEMNNLCNLSNFSLDPKNAWKKIKVKNLNQRFASNLKAAAQWRESEAQKKNIPKNRILKDESLVQLAANIPKNEIEFKKIRGISKNSLSSNKIKDLINSLKRAELINKNELPIKSNYKFKKHSLIELLKVLLKLKCEENFVSENLVASSKDLKKLAIEDNPEILALKGWRYDIFGKDALELKKGNLYMTIKEDKIFIKKL
ncbi:ribonuclease D [Alphaproteobacteria bacterium]|nr:ribonuclease D [Alphaproteobacteria bacterium]